MDRQVRARGQVNRRNESYVAALAMSPSNVQMDLDDQSARMSPMMELTIVGGLGVFIMITPNVAAFMKEKFQQVKTRVILLKDRLGHTKITKKLEILNRRRKFGSLIRVIGSILPSYMFTPPCRIYIPNWAKLENNQWGFTAPIMDLPMFDVTKKADLPTENDVGDGLIEAFELGSEIISSLSEEDEEDDDIDNASSCPEGWTQEQRKFVGNFNPTLINATDVSFARCSTPKANVETLHFNASQIVNQQTSKIYDDQGDITELKKMVEGLMMQINCLNQSLLTTQTQLAAQQQIPQVSSIEQPKVSVSVPITAPIIPVASNVAPPTGPPPPPPPPPPPMPPMPSFGNKPLVISKKGNQDKLIEKKPQISLSDVLKELPNAKLRRIERSPGGTPLKPQLKLAKESMPLDIGNQLAFALRKRYESMHSPACDTDTDKENMDGSDDSFDDSPLAAKRVLFPSTRSPRKRSSGPKSQNENISPFGQHLLKKRNVPQAKENTPPNVFALREQN